MSNLTEETATRLAAAMLTLAAGLNRQVENPKPHTELNPQVTQKDFDFFLGFASRS